MPEWDFIGDIKKAIKGERIENPGFNNPEIAKAIADQWLENDLRQHGAIRDIRKEIQRYYGKRDLAKQVLSIQPFYYDESNVWWYWNIGLNCWKLTDDTNILNMINALTDDVNTIKSKEKTEIIEAMKQEARLRKPKSIETTWVQFKKEFIDINTGEVFDATPEYFCTNPIPWIMNKDNIEQTPNMDRIFEEWVGVDNVKLLYQIIAYCLLPDYPIHRLFCFIGAGLNGKSCYLRMIEKFIGSYNVCTTELDTLMASRFEITKLHKKLVCLLGETNFKELSQTSKLKKLTGQDMIGFEYKNKNPFEDRNYAKILISTNNLPETSDKSDGFYRRWHIIDFPNRFSEKKDILLDIPNEEYESLALKCPIILKELLKERQFIGDGTIEDKKKRYEDKSNPLDKFITECCDVDDLNSFVWKFEFIKRFSQWCKDNRFREFSETYIGGKMKEKGFQTTRKQSTWLIDGQQKYILAWEGLKWK